ncbi:MAG: BatD family protein [Verrucomicrobiales bacterium]|nr:BatD family protein [Verrucomicrobiales bacterium]
MRINFSHLILWLAILRLAQFPGARAQTPPANPAAEQLIQIMRSQPAMDISAPVTATVSFDPPLVRPGEKSIYRVTFNAAEVSIRQPEQIPAPPQLKLHRSISGQNMQTADGAMKMFSTFNYDATATEPGVFTVPEFTVEVYGQPVVVPAAQLEVRNELPEPHEPVRQLLVETSATNVYVGESFNVTVRLPATPANGIEGVAQMQFNGSGFIVKKNAARQSFQPAGKNGGKVAAFNYETSVTPITAGPLKLSAQGFTAGMQFGGPPKYLLLESEPVTINVRPLPTESELPGFTGAVGNYTCDLPGITTNMLRMGEPVQLTVVIRGQQNLNRINPPVPPHVQGWQIFPAVRGGVVAGAGTNRPGASFKYTMIPVSDEARATPAIPFSCFDPARGRYVDLTIPPVPVTVIAGETLTNAEAAQLLSEGAPDLEKKAGLSRLAKTPGYTAGSLVPLQLHAWFPLVQVLPALGFCGLWLWDRRRRHLEQHPEIVRRRLARRALRRELRSLEHAAAAGDAAGFIRCAINALQIASAPHYPAAPRALVCGDVLQILTVAEREGKAGETVRRFFAAADAAAFASATGNNVELLAEKSALKEILAKLEARL